MTLLSEKKSLSIDLFESTQNQIEYANYIQTSEDFVNSQILIEKAIYRYEKVWLPLCQNLSSRNIQLCDYYPPHDVAWVWRSHLLSPKEYRDDLIEQYGQVFDHSCLTLSQIMQKQEMTVNEWEELSGFAFDYNDFLSVDHNIFDTFKSRLSVDLKNLCKSHKIFISENFLSLPNKEFIEFGIKEYLSFLNFRTNDQCTFFVSDKLLDLIWHTHLLHPTAYYIDCYSLFGKLLIHSCFRTECDEFQCFSLRYSFGSLKDHLFNQSDSFENFIEYKGIFEIEKMTIEKLSNEVSFKASLINDKKQILIRHDEITDQKIHFNKSTSFFLLHLENGLIDKEKDDGKSIECHSSIVNLELFVPSKKTTVDKAFNFIHDHREYLADIRYTLCPDKTEFILRFGFEKKPFKQAKLKDVLKVYSHQVEVDCQENYEALAAEHLLTIGENGSVAFQANIVHVPSKNKSTIFLSKDNLLILQAAKEVVHDIKLETRKIKLPYDSLCINSKWRNKGQFGHLEVEIDGKKIIVPKSLRFLLPIRNLEAMIDLKEGKIEMKIRQNELKYEHISEVLMTALIISLQYVMFMPKPFIIFNKLENVLEEKINENMPVSIRNSKLLDLMGFYPLINSNLLFKLQEEHLNICSIVSDKRWFNFSAFKIRNDECMNNFKNLFEFKYLIASIMNKISFRKSILPVTPTNSYLPNKSTSESQTESIESNLNKVEETTSLSNVILHEKNKIKSPLYKNATYGYRKLSNSDSIGKNNTSSRACVLL